MFEVYSEIDYLCKIERGRGQKVSLGGTPALIIYIDFNNENAILLLADCNFLE